MIRYFISVSFHPHVPPHVEAARPASTSGCKHHDEEDMMPTTHEAEIRSIIADHCAGLRDRDPERVLAAHTADVVQYTLAPPLQHLGVDVEAVRAWMAGFVGPIELEPKDLEVTAGDDVAFAYGLTALRATPVGAPGPFELWMRTTVGLRRIDGRWRVTHYHESTPFHMEVAADGSFRAATDLQP
jgi:ketosteroid isomerase-like protein